MTLVIMAAGMGSRFGGLKQLTPLGDNGEYIIDFTVYDAIRAGFNKIIFVIRKEHEEIFEEKIAKKMRAKGVDIEYRFQENTLPNAIPFPEGRTKPFGTAHAILSAGKIDEPFAVVNADDFYESDPFKKLHHFLSTSGENEWCMIGYKVKNTLSPVGSVARGVCITKDGMLEKITEYKSIEEKNGVIFNTFPDGTKEILSPEQKVSMTCFGFTPAFSEALPKLFDDFLENNKNDLSTCEFYLPSAVQTMLDTKKYTMKVIDTNSEWKGVTYKNDSDDFRNFIIKLKKDGIYPETLW